MKRPIVEIDTGKSQKKKHWAPIADLKSCNYLRGNEGSSQLDRSFYTGGFVHLRYGIFVHGVRDSRILSVAPQHNLPPVNKRLFSILSVIYHTIYSISSLLSWDTHTLSMLCILFAGWYISIFWTQVICNEISVT